MDGAKPHTQVALDSLPFQLDCVVRMVKMTTQNFDAPSEVWYAGRSVVKQIPKIEYVLPRKGR